ncbi:MAG: glycosyltransferase [Paracoccaceae bacterium]|nr:MAG: glycosyltransferase [Paracoccaceae bacterium]
MRRVLSVIIPASNEADHIGACLAALFASGRIPGGAEAVVVANGCTDDTADRARAMGARAEAAGWRLTVEEIVQGGKVRALNLGDTVAMGETRAYLDADVRVSPPLMAQIVLVLHDPAPRYATGRPVIPPPRSRVTRAYARFWQRLPFAAGAAPGFGLFAVNGAGRERWAAFPDLISDDTYVRLLFTPAERLECPATYQWPMIEGFAALVRVRQRQDAGVAEIARLHPALLANEGKHRLRLSGLLRLAVSDPVGFAVYAMVSLAVRLRPAAAGWVRGR